MLTASEGLPREHLPTLLRKRQWAPLWAKLASFRSQSATLSERRAPASILLSVGLIIRDTSTALSSRTERLPSEPGSMAQQEHSWVTPLSLLT